MDFPMILGYFGQQWLRIKDELAAVNNAWLRSERRAEESGQSINKNFISFLNITTISRNSLIFQYVAGKYYLNRKISFFFVENFKSLASAHYATPSDIIQSR